MRPRSQCSSSGLADERRAATVLGRLAERSIDPQKRAVFRPQLCKITNQFATLDSSFAVSTLRLPDARWSSLVARRAHNPKVGGSNPPRATRRKGPVKTGPFYFCGLAAFVLATSAVDLRLT